MRFFVEQGRYNFIRASDRREPLKLDNLSSKLHAPSQSQRHFAGHFAGDSVLCHASANSNGLDGWKCFGFNSTSLR